MRQFDTYIFFNVCSAIFSSLLALRHKIVSTPAMQRGATG